MVLYKGESILMRGCCPFSFNQPNTMRADSFMSTKLIGICLGAAQIERETHDYEHATSQNNYDG